jgi:hypothetical protein
MINTIPRGYFNLSASYFVRVFFTCFFFPISCPISKNDIWKNNR